MVLESLEEVFRILIKYSILALETVGALILLYFSLKAIVVLFKSPTKSKILLAEGITTALSFLLGSEVLKTISAPDWKDIGMTCAILLMRAAVTILIHWEKKSEIAEEKEEEAEKDKHAAAPKA